ncbi:hypothetical protein GCM10028807_49830 [Spirosoma daeguense]
MAGKNINVNEDNFYEWLCSTGHLLPRNERELNRFEQLYPKESITVNVNSIDPLTIISGNLQEKDLSIKSVKDVFVPNSQSVLRMAARKYDGLPKDILDQIKQNQQNINDGSNNKPES